MISYLIKYYFIFFCCLYISCKLINIKPLHCNAKLLLFVSPLLISILSCTFKYFYGEPLFVIPLLLIWGTVCFLTQAPQLSFVSSLIAFAISYSLFAISSFIIILCLSPIFKTERAMLFLLFAILSAIAQTLSSISIFRIKRFTKGMPFLTSSSFINIATIIGTLVLSFAVYKYPVFSRQQKNILPILFCITIPCLIHWWQAQITKSYNHSIMLRNIESLTGELEESYKKNAILEAENEDQGRLIHHDNKRLAAMENAICEYLVSDFSDVEATKDRGRTLCLEIQSLSRNRSDTLKEIYEKKSRHYSTGIGSLDTLLNYMDKRATEDNIEFTVHNAVELETYIPKQISTEDLTHMLSDLLENAIIASKGTTDPVIQLQFYVSEKHFIIEVADSGIPFEAKSIVNFGLSRLTTHEATGGSGIGLMDIWSIKEKYGATLHIEEFETPHPFTKKISLVFNHKNLYSVKTYRADEITALSKRHDLRIY